MKRRTHTTWSMAIGVLAVSCVASPQLAAQQTSVAAHNALVSQFAALRDLSFHADVILTIHQEISGSDIPVGVPITGVFEYSAHSNRWRRRSWLDEKLYPGMDTVVAYDGSAYSYEMRDQGVVSVAFDGPEHATGMTLPNPILELGRFCSPHDDENAELLLTSVRNGAKNPTAPVAVKLTSDGGTQVTCKGSVASNLGSMFILKYDQDGLLRSVEQSIANSDTPLARIECDNYKQYTTDDGRTMYWPRSVIFIGMDPATGLPGATVAMKLHLISVKENTSPGETYSPNWSGSSRVWLDYPGMFIR